MKKTILIIVFVISVLHNAGAALFAQEYKQVEFTAFCYHDVRSDVFGKLYHDTNALNIQHLIQHFQWLKDKGYTVVSREHIQQAKNGTHELPDKAVLLTFDDGLISLYHSIFPLLIAFDYPATIAIVTDWIENDTINIVYGNQTRTAKDFLTWDQISEMSDSGLIEIASHTHNMHKGVIANPQNNAQPAATSRIYQSGYESDEEYASRITKDLQTSANLIEQHTGKKPKSIVWPYGMYSEHAWKIAQELGFESSLTLGAGENVSINSEHIDRHLIDKNPSLAEFKSYFRVDPHNFPQRVMHIDLDYVYDDDPVQQEKNLGLMLERVKKMSINTVFLQAYADSDGDGNANALYFKNEHLPVKADLFNRAAWQLRTRTSVNVYAWMPVSAFVFDDAPEINEKLGVKAWQAGEIISSDNNYKRLSIFNPAAKEIIYSIYDSLSKYNTFAGILYHDDALLTDFEDLGDDAIGYYRNAGIEFESINDLIHDRAISNQWAKVKSRAIIDFTNELTAIIRSYQPEIKTARNIYAQVITNPVSEHWFAQNFEAFVSNYDYTAVMAMPYMEQKANPDAWLTELARLVKRKNVSVNKIIFELQSKNWLNGENIDSRILARQMKILQANGIANYGYYPDDFIGNHPHFETIAPLMSLATYPYYKR
ncbi:MAG: poly-beta-1,6-N-acetyl-D-glucosamine N-deacetylase PgaB [Gammaproteobacteria bacterium]|nr:poly-beta-1,6-N-acetyl-D-glucosamine N-deacetylase PgaB [Gammaproteobacteria bacterium]NNC97433.1 poly-beta-1,6-N-acetyl-D-glucosamine N-deacetylase PgaB [Gammaproteobacteria bacterium]NNM13906.1 poly-beta-1,6-N-acetyl-D-glucosamine N-deacetylase PgaB [Gammaproteobacteria bacterium]